MLKEEEEESATTGFRKKVYTRMYNDSISHMQRDQEKTPKKIIPSNRISGIRENFKQAFLPLLIDVFELRQMVQNFKAKRSSPFLFTIGQNSKSPKEVIERLQQLQDDIEESKRWCEGVILQIEKGIEEAKEALQFIENSSEIEKSSPPKAEDLSQKYQINLDALMQNRRKNRFWNTLFKRKKNS